MKPSLMFYPEPREYLRRTKADLCAAAMDGETRCLMAALEAGDHRAAYAISESIGEWEAIIGELERVDRLIESN